MPEIAELKGPKEIGLTEFMKEQIDEVSAFFDYWVCNMDEDPEHFPQVMAPGEWDEQFRAWSLLRQGRGREIKAEQS